ncbi:MAG: divalent-cation tolerance protein CutA [Xenococcaceae cyanobacterium MO_188.B29]|nr:divalent-cation tolerance protein CutA [Xenococcaceae cyanobacterium MO_188.B29]
MTKPEEYLYCVVMVTVSSEQEGEKIAEALLTEKLAACVSITPVNSIYTWQEKINRDREWQLFIKTSSNLFPQLRQKIQEIHSYEVPEIIALPIISGFQPYLNWIADSTKE